MDAIQQCQCGMPHVPAPFLDLLPHPQEGNPCYIYFIVNVSVHKESFYPSPKGFYFRGKTYKEVDVQEAPV